MAGDRRAKRRKIEAADITATTPPKKETIGADLSTETKLHEIINRAEDHRAKRRRAKRRKIKASVTTASPLKKKATAADLPAEIKLMIFDLLEQEGRVIIVKCRLSFNGSSSADFKAWLAKSAPPASILLSLCHETRSKALQRYSSLSGPYQNFRIDFQRDIIQLVPQAHLCSNVEFLAKVDLRRMENISAKMAENNPAYGHMATLMHCGRSFPRVKVLYLNRKIARDKEFMQRFKRCWELLRQVYAWFPPRPVIKVRL